MFTLQFAPLALLSSNASSAPWLRLFLKHRTKRSKVFAWWQRQAGGQLQGRPGWKAKLQGQPMCANKPGVEIFIWPKREENHRSKMKFKTIRSTNFSREMYLDPSGLLAVDRCHRFLQTNWGPLCWSAPPENQEWARILFYDAKAWWAGWYLIILVIFANQHLYGDVESDVDHDREDYDYDQARPPRPGLGKFNNVICKERRFWCDLVRGTLRSDLAWNHSLRLTRTTAEE